MRHRSPPFALVSQNSVSPEPKTAFAADLGIYVSQRVRQLKTCIYLFPRQNRALRACARRGLFCARCQRGTFCLLGAFGRARLRRRGRRGSRARFSGRLGRRGLLGLDGAHGERRREKKRRSGSENFPGRHDFSVGFQVRGAVFPLQRRAGQTSCGGASRIWGEWLTARGLSLPGNASRNGRQATWGIVCRVSGNLRSRG